MQKITESELRHWLNELKSLETTGSGSMPGFLKPFHFATLAASARARGRMLRVSHDALDYAIRMGLFEAIGQTAPHTVGKRPSNGRFVEARAVTEEKQTHQLSIDISRMFNNCADEQTEEGLQVLMSELLGNCCAHSTSQGENPFGLVCGQAWKMGNLAQLCIADTGIGIRESLKGNASLLERLNSQNACGVAVEYGVTGKPFGPHSGYGLALADGLIRENNGSLVVISGNEMYLNQCGANRVYDLENGWPGTIIIFEWNLDIALNLRAVYDSWPKPDKMNGEDYDDLFL